MPWIESKEERARRNKEAAKRAMDSGLCRRCKAEKPKLNCKHCQYCITYFVDYKAAKRCAKTKLTPTQTTG